MSRRTRMVELMAAAGLAPQLLQREAQRGQQEAQTTGLWANALDKIATNGLNTGIDVAQKSAAADANTAEQESINAGNTDALDRLASTGSLNPFRSSAIAKAKAAAGAGIEKKGIETQQRDLEAKQKQAQIDASNQAAAASKANVGLEDRKLQEQEDKDAAELNIKSFEEQDKRAALAAKKGASTGAGGGKPLKPGELDTQVTHPRAIIDDLDKLKDAAATAPSGMQAAAGDLAGELPIVGPTLQEKIAPGQQDFEGNVAIALANVNNAMDRRVSEATIKLWSKQLANPSLTADQRAAKIDEIKTFLSKLQTEREAGLTSSGYKVPAAAAKPAGSSSTKPPSPEAKAMAQQLLASGKTPDEVRTILKAKGLY